MTPVSIHYELTEAEAEIAGARAAWRLWLKQGLGARHVAPLMAFALAIAAVAALGLSEAISRRAAEISLILAAATFMALQLWTRRGLAAARRRGAAIAGELRRAGPVQLTLDEDAFVYGDAPWHVLRFAEDLQIEATDDLIYVWARTDIPLVWPRRAHATPEDAEAFLALARARLSESKPNPKGR